jgi:hypothetical protein
MAFGGDRDARAKAWAAEIGAARRRAGLLLPEPLADALRRLRASVEQWAVSEVAPGRLAPWLPVGFGFGIVLYFTADHEPAWWAALPLALAGVAVAYVSRHRAYGFPLALAFAALAAGFATATLRTVTIAHPVLLYPASSVSLSGLSRSARSASAATASCCACRISRAGGSTQRPTACGSRCVRARRRWSALSWS